MATDINEGLYDKYVSKFKKEHNSINLPQMEKWSLVNLKRLKGWLPEDKKIKILDAGCGHGNILHLLKMAGFVNVTGVDFSTEQIKIAKQINSNVYEDNIFEFLDKNKVKYDLIFAYDLAINKPNQIKGEAFNIGGGVRHSISLMELIKMLTKIMNKDILYQFAAVRPGDQKVYISNTEKIKNLLGWEPEVSVETGIKNTLEWTQENIQQI